MSPQYKPLVLWVHSVTKTPENAKRLIQLAKSVAEVESQREESGFFVVLSPREGQHFSQSTRLEIILNYESTDHLHDVHETSNAYEKFYAEKDDLLERPATDMSFIPYTGFLRRSKVPEVPLSEQFIWIAKLDAHDGKLESMMEAISTHAANVERTEDGTLSFLVLQGKDKNNSVTLFERYISEDYFNNVHATSESMKEYSDKVQSLMADRVTAGFRIVAGFVDKREMPA